MFISFQYCVIVNFSEAGFCSFLGEWLQLTVIGEDILYIVCEINTGVLSVQIDLENNKKKLHAVLTRGFVLTTVMVIHLLIKNKVICVCVVTSKVCKDFRFTYSHIVGRVLQTAPMSLFERVWL